MKKVINGFDVEVVDSTIDLTTVNSKLVFKAKSKEWRVVNEVTELGLIYNINGEVVVYGDFKRTVYPTQYDYYLLGEGMLIHAYEQSQIKGIKITLAEIALIHDAIVKDFYKVADSLVPTDLQFYNGEDELNSLDQSIEHDIDLLLLYMTYQKGVSWAIGHNIKADLNTNLVTGHLIINNEAFKFAINILEVLEGEGDIELKCFIDRTLTNLVFDTETYRTLYDNISSLVYENAMGAYEDALEDAKTNNEILALTKDNKRLKASHWAHILMIKEQDHLSAQEVATRYGVTISNVYQWSSKFMQDAKKKMQEPAYYS